MWHRSDLGGSGGAALSGVFFGLRKGKRDKVGCHLGESQTFHVRHVAARTGSVWLPGFIWVPLDGIDFCFRTAHGLLGLSWDFAIREDDSDF